MTSLLPSARPPDPTSDPSNASADLAESSSRSNPFKKLPTTLPPSSASTQRTPSGSNPFARPRLSHENRSFSRATLLPSLISPVRPETCKQYMSESGSSDVLKTPDEGPGSLRRDVTPKNGLEGEVQPGGANSISKPRQAWRMLWRGGMEMGYEGFRLDGLTFFALLSFPPPTPAASGRETNPFDNLPPLQPAPDHASTPSSYAAGTPGSPFPTPLAASTDLCLSLESMRGRKFLQVRGVTDLPEDEVLEGQEEGAQVQMSISEDSPLLRAYFSGLLCRQPKLSGSGRTLSAVVIGLGDEGFDGQHASTILIYGQIVPDSSFSTENVRSMQLHVGRRKPPPPPPSARKPRPGDPLPRAPLFFPSRQPKKPPPPLPFSRRALSRAGSRQFSREPSTSNIYAPPPRPTSADLAEPEASAANGKGDKNDSPGRRGNKRQRLTEEGEEARRRKSGKIVPRVVIGDHQTASPEADDDIFGRQSTSARRTPSESVATTTVHREEGALTEDISQVPETPINGSDENPSLSSKSKRTKVPQQILDNKATIRKQTLLRLEQCGFSREHDQFKDLFGMVTRGTYFAFRHLLEQGPLSKLDIQRVIVGHLDMYAPINSMLSNIDIKEEAIEDEQADVSVKTEYTLDQIKEEDEDEESEQAPTSLPPTERDVQL